MLLKDLVWRSALRHGAAEIDVAVDGEAVGGASFAHLTEDGDNSRIVADWPVEAGDLEIGRKDPVSNFVVDATAGTWTITINGDPVGDIAFDADAVAVAAALADWWGDPTATATGIGSVEDPFVVTFVGWGAQVIATDDGSVPLTGTVEATVINPGSSGDLLFKLPGETYARIALTHDGKILVGGGNAAPENGFGYNADVDGAANDGVELLQQMRAGNNDIVFSEAGGLTFGRDGNPIDTFVNSTAAGIIRISNLGGGAGGIRLTSPDGSQTKTIRLSNTGEVEVVA